MLITSLFGVGGALATATSYTHRPIGLDGGGWVTGMVQHESSGLLYGETVSVKHQRLTLGLMFNLIRLSSPNSPY